MVENLDFKLDTIKNALASLSHRTVQIEEVMTCFHNNGASIITPFRAYHAQNFEEVTLPSIQQDPVVLQRNEP